MGAQEGGRVSVVVFVVSLLATASVVILLSNIPISSTIRVTTGQEETTAIYVEVLNTSDWSATVPGLNVVAGPASSSNDVVVTPGEGPTLKECVQEVPSGTPVQGKGTCPLKSYPTGDSGIVNILNTTGTYYFVDVNKEYTQFNYALFAMNDSSSITVVVPWPSGNVVVSSESRAAVNPGGDPPFWPYPMYLIPDIGTSYSCSLGPCWGGNLSTAIAFNCANEAATPAGCRTTVASSTYYWEKYNLTIWYPDINESIPTINCEFETAGQPTGDLGAWCSAIGPNSFVMSEAPPPPA